MYHLNTFSEIFNCKGTSKTLLYCLFFTVMISHFILYRVFFLGLYGNVLYLRKSLTAETFPYQEQLCDQLTSIRLHWNIFKISLQLICRETGLAVAVSIETH